MKIHCPNCDRPIPAADVDLSTRLAKCRGCDEVFPLEGLPATPATSATGSSGVPERPFDARAEVVRSPRELLLKVPAAGMGGGMWGLLGFAVVWNGFIAFWTLGALGLFFGDGPDAFNWMFAAFSIPFWCAGAGMLAAVLHGSRSEVGLVLDRHELRYHRRSPVLPKRRTVRRADVQKARAKNLASSANDTTGPVPSLYEVEIVTRDGTLKVPAAGADEQRWLIAEINAFLAEDG